MPLPGQLLDNRVEGSPKDERIRRGAAGAYEAGNRGAAKFINGQSDPWEAGQQVVAEQSLVEQPRAMDAAAGIKDQDDLDRRVDAIPVFERRDRARPAVHQQLEIGGSEPSDSSLCYDNVKSS